MENHSRFKQPDLMVHRLRAGLRQYRVAQEAGIPPSLLSELETGRRPLTPRQHERLVAALDRLSPGGMAEEGGHGWN